MSWFGVGSRGSAIPTPQSLLRSVYVGRICVAVAIYLAAALKFAVAAPLDLLVTSFVLVATVVVTSGSFWYTHFLRRSPGRTFLYGQALFDVGLITTVVHLTGGRAAAGWTRGGRCAGQRAHGDRPRGPSRPPALL